MLAFRSLCFHICFYAVTAVMAVGGLPLLLGPRHWSRWLGTIWSRAVLWLCRVIIRMDYRITGALPPGPVLIASKHQSAFETFLFPVIRPDAVFVIKQELLRAPVVGWYLSRAGQIAIDRAANAAALRKMLAEARARVAEGLSLVIFPEGTRVAVGQSVPIRPGVSAIYTQLGLPVVPVTLDSGRFWARNSFIRYPGTIHVHFGPLIEAGLNRRAFQQRLEIALQELPEADDRVDNKEKRP